MLALAAGVDGTAPDRSSSWHASLLSRMGAPVPGRRGPVLSPSLRAAVDGLRAFRHRERNSYTADLDLRLVMERADEALITLPRSHDEVRAFLRSSPPAP